MYDRKLNRVSFLGIPYHWAFCAKEPVSVNRAEESRKLATLRLSITREEHGVISGIGVCDYDRKLGYHLEMGRNGEVHGGGAVEMNEVGDKGGRSGSPSKREIEGICHSWSISGHIRSTELIDLIFH
jgi:hypothetical protein